MPGRGGRGGRAKKSKGTQTMKKVTRKGAYKKNIKNQMMLRRAPLVETKSRTHSDIALLNGYDIKERDATEKENYDFLTLGALQQPLNWRIIPNEDAFTFVGLDSFTRIQQGLKPYQMIGDTITAKWLNTRLEVRFPQGELFPKVPAEPDELYRNMMIQEDIKVYAIWGYVTTPLHAPLEDSSGDRKTSDTISQAELGNHIKAQIKPFFNDDTDKLSFRPRETMNVKIERYVRLKPNLSQAIPTQATPVTSTHPTPNSIMQATGSIPNVMRSHNFTMNRKILYTEGEPVDPTGTDWKDYENNYPNNSWLPFCVIYNPGYKAMLQVTKQTDGSSPPPSRTEFHPETERRTQNMFFRWNDQIVYTDS